MADPACPRNPLCAPRRQWPGARRLLGAVAATAMAGALPPGIANAQSAVSPAPVMSVAESRQTAADLINNIRQRLDACGEQGMLALRPAAGPAPRIPPRPALVWNDALAQAAAQHAKAMADQHFFDHVDPQGRTVGRRVSTTGYRWQVVGENLAAGHETIAEAVRGWLLSSGHCEVMIDARFTEFGIARVGSREPGDPYGNYWALVVAQPKSTTVASR
ncbi:MAG: CAP domain-containing protein [Burkholderiaceae bacterium]